MRCSRHYTTISRAVWKMLSMPAWRHVRRERGAHLTPHARPAADGRKLHQQRHDERPRRYPAHHRTRPSAQLRRERRLDGKRQSLVPTKTGQKGCALGLHRQQWEGRVRDQWPMVTSNHNEGGGSE